MRKNSYEQYLSFWLNNRHGKSENFYKANYDNGSNEYFNFDKFLSDLIGKFSVVGQEIYSNRSSEKNLNH